MYTVTAKYTTFQKAIAPILWNLRLRLLRRKTTQPSEMTA